MQSYRHFPLLTKDKKENCPKIRNLGKVFHKRLRVLSRRSGLSQPNFDRRDRNSDRSHYMKTMNSAIVAIATIVEFTVSI